MATLNLFPARVAFVDDAGRLTPEAYRALQALFDRVGGAFGDLGNDTFSAVFGSFQPEEAECMDMVGQPATIEPAADGMQMQALSSDFLADMVFQPPSWGGNIEDVTVGASPYAYTAYCDGVLSVAGGTVSAFTTIARGSATITTGQMDGLFFLNAGDVATITYTSAPTIKFIPR